MKMPKITSEIDCNKLLFSHDLLTTALFPPYIMDHGFVDTLYNDFCFKNGKTKKHGFIKKNENFTLITESRE